MSRSAKQLELDAKKRLDLLSRLRPRTVAAIEVLESANVPEGSVCNCRQFAAVRFAGEKGVEAAVELLEATVGANSGLVFEADEDGERLSILSCGSQEAVAVIKAGRRVWKLLRPSWRVGRCGSMVRLRVVLSNAYPQFFVPQRIVGSGVVETPFVGGRITRGRELTTFKNEVARAGLRMIADLSSVNVVMTPEGPRAVDFAVSYFEIDQLDLLYPYPDLFWKEKVVGQTIV